MVNLKLRRLKKAFYWSDYSVNLFTDPIFKQLYLLLAILLDKKINFLDIIVREKLTPFNLFLLSVYYYKNDNIFLAFKYSYRSIKVSKLEKKSVPLYYKWFFIVLRRYRIKPKPDCIRNSFLIRLYSCYSSIGIDYKPKNFLESLEILKQRFIININRDKIINNPVYQFYLYKIYNIILYKPCNDILKIYFKDREKSKYRDINIDSTKKTDNILIKVIAIFLLVFLIIVILKKI
ncbi:MAG TPA: hypothetical protein PKW55_08435 [Spirochaetota bacterium]|nr:hypothetical protein [Spirochaetota bacterium]HOM39014.1 hypothetical protein [Spirochaetota bacterium]